MTLRATPGAMKEYHRKYAKLRNLPASERAAIDKAISVAMGAKCRCQPCKVLRAIGTMREAVASMDVPS